MKKIFYTVLAAATLAGMWGYYLRVTVSDEATNLGSIVPWGLWVASYIYFIGLSAGGFLISTLVTVFRMERFEKAGRIALAQAAVCLLIALMLIITDLGHPERALTLTYHFNPTSVMAWMFIFYNLYFLIVLVELYLSVRPDLARSQGWQRALCLGYTDVTDESLARDRRWLRRLGALGIPTAVIVHGGVGCIFATAKGHPIWMTGMTPVIFLVSALASGGALLTFLSALLLNIDPEEKTRLVRDLALLTSSILIVELIMFFFEIFVALYSSIPAHTRGYELMLFGPYWYVFWIVQVLIGAVVPLWLVFKPSTHSVFRFGLAGALIVLGTFGTRLNIVIPPLVQPAFDALPHAYHHPRFQPVYFPSLMEWLCLIGAVAVCIWIFLFLVKTLPLNPKKEAMI